MPKRPWKRRQMIVDRRFQLGISFKVIFALACYLVLFYLMAVFAPFVVMVVGGSTENALIAAERQIVTFVSTLLLPLLLTFACMALHIILISHRIAGPVYRLQRCLEAVRDGDLGQHARLRDGDYLVDLAETYNDMLTSLRADVETLVEQAQGMLDAAAAAANDPRAAVEAEKRAKGLVELLGAYTTSASRPEPEEEESADGEENAATEEEAVSPA